MQSNNERVLPLIVASHQETTETDTGNRRIGRLPFLIIADIALETLNKLSILATPSLDG